MGFFSKQISYKTSLLIIVVFLFLAATATSYTLKLKETRIDEKNRKIADLKNEINNLDKDTGALEEDNQAKDSDQQSVAENTNQNDTSNTTPTPPATQPPPPEPDPTQPPPSNNTVVVTINSAGNYSQLNITINKGDTIKWVNNDDRKHWPASNPHPQHTNYPGFDSGGINPGGSWSFTFNNKGTWGWHDHQFPSTTGTITVL
ncbi:MAG: hypothetical protein A3A57_02830 [Candidatus Woykebacteria bacterium RIFCSPLOWO2_01_FULL_41_12]|uniref:EfeO-type cupredoxin-like domain-containing protein n=1 Tax=Candidatus Woykebacteria bacterium RIFCSPLOWO2_01_FULL_41_12 TaxID=1802604 RepID=A0A1G1WVN2_9BACT|nr:MAG: hypothetical protein A3A57_02830 [Candidatus Woykebacteria bacterium RIFCSPLOWO2_01_FULL_41_12]